MKDRKLHVNKKEAEIVRLIFEHYANKPKCEPLHKLLDVLHSKGHKNKSYITQKGKRFVGKPFTIKQLYHLLNNLLYLGKVRYKGEVYDGEHDAIIHQELWDRVHSKMDKKQFINHPRKKSEQPKLVGKLYDYLGHRLSPTYSYKYSEAGRYKMRYYINREIATKGKTTSEFKRIRAEMVDDVVLAEIAALQKTLLRNIIAVDNQALSSALLKSIKNMMNDPVESISRVMLFPHHMEVSISFDTGDAAPSGHDIQQIVPKNTSVETAESGITLTQNISAYYRRTGGQLHIITENGKKITADVNARYQYPDDKTFIMLTKGLYWNKQLEQGAYKNQKEIARADGHSPEYVKRACKLKFLSPKIIGQIASTKSSAQLHIEQLVACHHWDWQYQEQALLLNN